MVASFLSQSLSTREGVVFFFDPRSTLSLSKSASTSSARLIVLRESAKPESLMEKRAFSLA
jgi:hypothetical protein